MWLKKCFKLDWLVLLVIVVVWSMACANFVQNSARGLAVSKQSYDTTFTILGDLYQKGLITDEQKLQAITYGKLYKDAHNQATSALLTYSQSLEEGDKQAYLSAIDKASKSLADFLDYARPFLLKGGK